MRRCVGCDREERLRARLALAAALDAFDELDEWSAQPAVDSIEQREATRFDHAPRARVLAELFSTLVLRHDRGDAERIDRVVVRAPDREVAQHCEARRFTRALRIGADMG